MSSAERYAWLVVWCVLCSQPAHAQTPPTSTPVTQPSVDPVVLDDLSLVEILQVDERVTTATRSIPIDAELAPSILSVITREQIARYGYRTIPEALASVPGLFLVNDFTTYNLAIRGIHAGPDSWSRMVKFMIDSKPVQYMATGGALLGPEFVPITAVERIEIVRGPASALYGANAFLGVVNVITRKPERQGLNAVLVAEGALVRDNLGGGGGAYLRAQTRGRRPVWLTLALHAEQLDRSGLAVPTQSPNALDYAGQTSRGDLSTPASVLLRAGYDGGAIGDFEIESVLQRLHAHSAFNQVDVLQQRALISQVNSVTRLDHRLPLYDTWSWGPELRQQLQLHSWVGLALAQTLDDELYVTDRASVHRKRRQQWIEGGAELSYVVGPHSLLAGVEAQGLDDPGEVIFDQVESSDTRMARNVADPVSTHSVSAFAQAIAYPWQPLGLTASVRYDRGNIIGDAFTYRLSSVLQALDGLVLKAALGTSFVPPALSQLYAIPLTLPGGVVGNPELRNQQAQTAELSVQAQPVSALRVGVTGYRTQIQDRVENVPQGNFVVAANQESSLTLGLELEAAVDVDRFGLEANLSLQDTELEEPAVTGFRWDTVYGSDPTPPSFPRWLAQLRGHVAIPEVHLDAALSGLLVGERKATAENILIRGERYNLPAAFVLGLHVSTRGLELWGQRETRASLHVEDLLGTGYLGSGAMGVDLPAQGRSVYLRITQEL